MTHNPFAQHMLIEDFSHQQLHKHMQVMLHDCLGLFDNQILKKRILMRIHVALIAMGFPIICSTCTKSDQVHLMLQAEIALEKDLEFLQKGYTSFMSIRDRSTKHAIDCND